MQRAIAIDFDGCLFETEFPFIKKPITYTLEVAKQEQAEGAKLILWTCRSGEYLQEAISACENYGLHFDAINENLPERIDVFGNDSRKIFADEYWDDRSVRMPSHVPCRVCPTHTREQDTRFLLSTYDEDGTSYMDKCLAFYHVHTPFLLTARQLSRYRQLVEHK